MKRTIKEKKERKIEFAIYRAKGGKLNNYGNRVGNGKCVK